jgi:ribulose kinase
MKKYTLGIDYGTLSGRDVLVDVEKKFISQHSNMHLKIMKARA